MQHLSAISKMTQWSQFVSKQTIQHHSNPSLCPNHWCWRSRWLLLWKRTRPSGTNTKNDVLLIIGDWNAKVESQEIPRITDKFGLRAQNEAGQRLAEFCQENTLVIVNPLSQQPKMTLHLDITRWSTLKFDWLCCLQPQMEKFYTVSKSRTWSWLWLWSWAPYCKIDT